MVNFSLMAQYNQRMNRAVYCQASTLSHTEITADQGAFFGSVLGTLNHIMVGDLIWLKRFATLPSLVWLDTPLGQFPTPTSLNQMLHVTLPALEQQRIAVDTLIMELADVVTPGICEQTLRYRNTQGQAKAENLGMLLQHFFNHQTHHRGQVSTLLYQMGVDVGTTDLLADIAELRQ